MPFWVYILKNENTSTLYTGQTSNLLKRLERHNDKEHGKLRYTRKHEGSWKLIYSEEYSTRSDAMRREQYLKSGQGRQWIKDHVLADQNSWQSPPLTD